MIREKLLFGIDDSNEREKLMKKVDEKLSLDFVIKSLRVAEKSTGPKAIMLPDPKMLIIGSQECLLRLFMINVLRTNVSNVGKAITKIRDVQLMELNVQNAINSTTGPECVGI